MEQKLGRGLSAIFGADSGDEEQMKKNIVNIEVGRLFPHKGQPRKYFDDTKLKELSDSIALHGVIQPLVARKVGNDYELLAGERRLRAAKMAGLTEVPVYVIECTDQDVLALSLIENIQRDDLNSIEEAEALQNLIKEHRCTQENLAFMVCKSRSYISNALRLLTLPDVVQNMVKTGQLSSGHVKILVGRDDAEELARFAVENQMSVRAFELLVKDKKLPFQQHRLHGTPISKYESPEEIDISERITGVLGMKSKLKITNNGGVLTIYCNSCEQLESLTQTLLNIDKKDDKKFTPSAEWI